MAPTGCSGTGSRSNRGRPGTSPGRRTCLMDIHRAGMPGRSRLPVGGTTLAPQPCPRIIRRRRRNRGRIRGPLLRAPVPHIRPGGRRRGIRGGQRGRIHWCGRRDEGRHRETNGNDRTTGRTTGTEPARRHATRIDPVDHLALRTDCRQDRGHLCITSTAPDPRAGRECRPARDTRRRTVHMPIRVPRQSLHRSRRRGIADRQGCVGWSPGSSSLEVLR